MKLKELIENAIENDIDELDFFMDALEHGFTLEDFKELGNYDYAKQFIDEHGLI